MVVSSIANRWLAGRNSPAIAPPGRGADNRRTVNLAAPSFGSHVSSRCRSTTCFALPGLTCIALPGLTCIALPGLTCIALPGLTCIALPILTCFARLVLACFVIKGNRGPFCQPTLLHLVSPTNANQRGSL